MYILFLGVYFRLGISGGRCKKLAMCLVCETGIFPELFLFVQKDVLMNLICSLERLGISHHIIGALDQPLFDSLQAKGFPVFPAFAWSTTGQEDLKPGFTRSPYATLLFLKLFFSSLQ